MGTVVVVDVEDRRALAKGREACRRGVAESPYPPGSDNDRVWWGGWHLEKSGCH